MNVVSPRELNRWTLARQMLLERARLDAVTAIDRLAGMQAQYSPSPYIGLWSRLCDFSREELEQAVLSDRVVKATLMRGTLHLVSARHFDNYRVAVRNPYHVYSRADQTLHELGVDVEAMRASILDTLRDRSLKRQEVMALVRQRLPVGIHESIGWSAVALTAEVCNVPHDALFGYFGGSRYRVSPPVRIDVAEGLRHVAAAYFAAFGPATRADLATWSGQTVAAFTDALESLGLVRFRAEDGRTLLDLPDAPRPDADVPAPVRFLPKWDNLLLAYARRERVLPEAHRKIVIRKNGDVLPTFLVGGTVGGTWEAPLRGRATMTLTLLGEIAPRDRAEVEEEAVRLLAWLRTDTDRREIRWVLE